MGAAKRLAFHSLYNQLSTYYQPFFKFNCQLKNEEIQTVQKNLPQMHECYSNTIRTFVALMF